MEQKLYYNNIYGLRNTNTKLQYTEKQIKEIIKCSSDIEYFLANYIKVIHPDKGLVPFKLYDFQKEIIEYYQKYDRVIIMSSRQCITGDTEIVVNDEKTTIEQLFKTYDKPSNNVIFLYTKFIQSLDISHLNKYIETPFGKTKILELHKTIPYRKYRIELANGLVLEGAHNHVVITASNEEIYLKNALGETLQTIKGNSKVVKVIDLGIEENMYDMTLEDERGLYYSNGILSHNSGKTISTVGYLLHYILFNEAKNVAILANKGETARYILSILKDMYVNLPIWLQQGVVVWNKTFIELENKCKVLTSSTSDNALRGYTCNILYVDETAFIPNWNTFFSSVYPIISAGKDTKIIFSSTPLGLNHFAKLWFEAEQGLNGFKPLKIPYTKVPGRDEKWAEKIRKEIGERRFKQEYELQFLGSDNTLLSPEALNSLYSKKPIRTDADDNILIYKDPIENHIYILIIDIAHGKGQDYSTIQVIDITNQPFEQVAVFRSNTVPTNVLPFYINYLGNLYNEGLVVVENNTGEDVLYILNYEYEYPNIFYWNKEFGLKTTKKVKQKGNSHLKYLIENKQLLIYDFDTIHELSVYALHGNTYQAIKGEHDDLVMPLVLFAYIVGDKQLNEYYINQEVYKPPKQIEHDNFKFIGFYTNGEEVEKLSIEKEEF